jgi:hypothetical protein
MAQLPETLKALLRQIAQYVNDGNTEQSRQLNLSPFYHEFEGMPEAIAEALNTHLLEVSGSSFRCEKTDPDQVADHLPHALYFSRIDQNKGSQRYFLLGPYRNPLNFSEPADQSICEQRRIDRDVLQRRTQQSNAADSALSSFAIWLLATLDALLSKGNYTPVQRADVVYHLQFVVPRSSADSNLKGVAAACQVLGITLEDLARGASASSTQG